MTAANPSSPAYDLKLSLRPSLKIATFVGTVAAVIVLFLPNYYKSQASLLPVNGDTGNLSSVAAAAAAIGVGFEGNSRSDSNFVDILNSRWMLESLINSEFRFRGRRWRYGSEHTYQETLFVYLGQQNLDKAVNKFDSIYDATKDMKSNLITLTAETTSPELSQQIVRRAIDLLNQFAVQNSRTRGSEKLKFATARLEEARHELDVSEGEFLAFLERSRNYQTSADPAIRLRGARLEAELNLHRILVNTLTTSREQALLDAKNDVPILNVLDSGNLPIEKSRPNRSIIVIFAIILTFLGSLTWFNRAWVLKRLILD